MDGQLSLAASQCASAIPPCNTRVDKGELPALEFVARYKTSRPNVGIMMAGQGGALEDMWAVRDQYLKERTARWVRRAGPVRHLCGPLAGTDCTCPYGTGG